MTRPALPAFERELRALARRVKSCPVHAVHFQHGRAHEAVLALAVAEDALRAGAATARLVAREELQKLKTGLDAWEHPENADDAGSPTQEAPASSPRSGAKKRTPAQSRRAAAREAAA